MATDPIADEIATWLLELCRGLAEAGDREAIRIEHGPGVSMRADSETTYVFEVFVPRGSFGGLVGTGGQTANGIRRLTSAAARAHRWHHKPDVSVVPPEKAHARPRGLARNRRR